MKAAIVLTVRGMTAMLPSFMRYHRHVGFERVYIYFDDPSDPGIEVVAPFAPFAHITPHNDALQKRWQETDFYREQKFATRHIALMDRQSLNVILATQHALADGIDWLLHIDADELFYTGSFFGDDTITASDVFQKLTDNGLANVAFYNQEAIVETMEIGDPFREVTAFKRNERLLANGVFTADQRTLIERSPFPNRYFTNYTRGKSAARVSAELRPDSVHDFFLPEQISPTARAASYLLERNRIMAAAHQRLPIKSITRRLLKKQYERYGAVGNPMILHYPNCGFGRFWQKYQRANPIDRTAMLKLDPFHQEAWELGQAGDETAARAFYQRRVIADRQTVNQFTAAGLAKRYEKPAAFLNQTPGEHHANRAEQVFGQETRKARDVNQTLLRFWEYFKPYRSELIVIAVLVVISTFLQVLSPILIGQAIDCFLTVDVAGSAENCFLVAEQPTELSARLGGLAAVMGVLAVFYIIGSVISGRQFFTAARAGYKMLHDLRIDIFRHIHRLSLGYFGKNSAGDTMSRITNDIDTVVQMVGFPLISTIQSTLLIGFLIVAMFTRSIPYALLSLMVVPFMVIAVRRLSALARKAFRVARQEIGEVNADLQENIAAVREVQAFSREDENIEQFRAQNAANRDANIRAQVYSTALAPIVEVLGYLNIAIIIGVGGWAVLNGGNLFGSVVSAGLIVTFVEFSQQFQRPIQQIATLWANIQSAVAGGERIFDLLDEEPEIEDSPKALEMPQIEGQIELSNVWAEYNPGEPVLQGVNIKAKAGDTIAIVGPTGAGKTTIINLLPRFYDVTEGNVMIDGTDVREVTRKSLRDQIGIVLQDTFLFSDTVMNNIRYGRPDATDEEVIAAAKLARADTFVERLSDGYETVLGERGSGLSQGQRQLLAIARVALMNPRILILDEATSSVDTRTEREIQTALDNLLADRTSFVVAHRLSTIRNADQVIVLKGGRIIEEGTHDSLLEQSGFYAELYNSQFRRTQPATA